VKRYIEGWIAYWCGITWKMRLSRFLIRWNRFKKKSLNTKKSNIDNTQKRAMSLFRAMLKNKNTNLNHSPESGARFIESDFVWLSMSSAMDANNYIMNIVDESIGDVSHSHEVLLPKEHAYEIIDEFDIELERRFRILEGEKKKLVITDLDNLILKINNN
jgi:hypothetical protein